MKAALKCFNCAFVFRSADKMAGNQYADGCMLAAPCHVVGWMLHPKKEDAPQGQRAKHQVSSQAGCPGHPSAAGKAPGTLGYSREEVGVSPITMPGKRAPPKAMSPEPVSFEDAAEAAASALVLWAGRRLCRFEGKIAFRAGSAGRIKRSHGCRD